MRIKNPGVLIAALVLVTCGVSCGPAKVASQAVIDCVAADRAQITAVMLSFTPLISGDAPDWLGVENRAIAAGETIGGCALAELVQGFLAPPVGRAAPAASNGNLARAALEDFRTQHAGGATFHTPVGDL